MIRRAAIALAIVAGLLAGVVVFERSAIVSLRAQIEVLEALCGSPGINNMPGV